MWPGSNHDLLCLDSTAVVIAVYLCKHACNSGTFLMNGSRSNGGGGSGWSAHKVGQYDGLDSTPLLASAAEEYEPAENRARARADFAAAGDRGKSGSNLPAR
jgi:hypothetical protein